jgi:hypothetical protein
VVRLFFIVADGYGKKRVKADLIGS